MKYIDTPFVTSPRDPLSVIDAYNKKGNSIAPLGSFGNDNITTITDAVLSNPNQLKSMLERLLERSLTNMAQNSLKTIMKRLSNLLGGDVSLLNSLSQNALQELIRGLRYETGNSYYKYKGSRVYSNKADYDSQNEYIEFYKSVFPNEDIKIADNDAEESAYGYLVDEALRQNNVDALEDILGKVTDPIVKDRIINRAVNTAFDEMELDGIAKLIEMDDVGVDRINTVRPNSVYEITSLYKAPSTTDLTQLELSNNLISVLDALEPLWYRYLRIGGDGQPVEDEEEMNTFIDNLTYYSTASASTLKLLAMNSLHKTNCIIAKDVKLTSIVNAQKRIYPNTLILQS